MFFTRQEIYKLPYIIQTFYYVVSILIKRILVNVDFHWVILK